MTLADGFSVLAMSRLLFLNLTHYVFIIDESLKSTDCVHFVQRKDVLGFNGSIVFTPVMLQHNDLSAKDKTHIIRVSVIIQTDVLTSARYVQSIQNCLSNRR